MGKSCKTPRQHDSDERERAEVNAQSSLPVDAPPLGTLQRVQPCVGALARLSIAVKTDVNSWELHEPAQPRPVLQLTPLATLAGTCTS